MLVPESSATRGAGHIRVRVAVGVIAAVLVSLLSPAVALADTTEECSAAYQKTQDLRDAGKLEDAIEQASICARDVCPKQLSQDCTEWKTALEDRVSTVIIEVVDASGAPVAEGTVSLDGEPWLDKLDGAAHSLSKGPHTLEITVKGSPTHKESITITEGEKNRKIPITVGSRPASSEPSPGGVHEIGPWVVGGVGLGALVAGAVIGGVVVHDYGVMKDECNEAEETCTRDGEAAQDRGRLLGPVTTSLLVGGGVLVAGGIIWLLLAPKAPEPTATSFFVLPSVSRHETGVVLGGSW